MTVRAALARLVEQGMIETQRGRGGGSFVREQHTTSSDAIVQRTLGARWADLRDTSDAIGRLHGTIAEAAAENRTSADAEVLRERLEGYRRAESGRASQRADELLHVAIAEAAHNATLRDVLFDLEARVSIAAPAHLWGGPDGRRSSTRSAAVARQTRRASPASTSRSTSSCSSGPCGAGPPPTADRGVRGAVERVGMPCSTATATDGGVRRSGVHDLAGARDVVTIVGWSPRRGRTPGSGRSSA
jgi:hypothetical protein